MSEENWYQILQVPREASALEIKTSYQSLILAHHPDKNGGKESQLFHLIVKAYEVLSNEVQRKKFDSLLLEAECDANVWMEVTPDQLDPEDRTFECRCGGLFVMEDELDKHSFPLLLDCDTCSLSIKVISA